MPDTLLFVYCVEGDIPDDTVFGIDGFLGNWQEGGCSFLFFRQQSDQFVNKFLGQTDNARLVDQYTMTYGQWQGDSVSPVQHGCFQICPPWVDPVCGPGQVAITLDAGVVFGNATHPTTRDCLLAIEAVCNATSVETMLDLGTGTGVLSLCAAVLGVKRIAAVDFTLIAARTAYRNVCLNGLSDCIAVINGRAEDSVSRPADLLVANIHYEVMESIVCSHYFAQYKRFILSGLLKSEGDQIEDFLFSQGARINRRWQTEEGWQTILGSQK